MKKLTCLLLVILLAFCLITVTACGKTGKTAEDLVIKIPLVTWGGYAALFAANNGPEPKTDSLFYKYGKFKVELVQEENPANQLTGFANGTYQIIWSTMDMIPLTYDSLGKDKNTVPKVIGLFDYSNGGDGIIVRGDIKDGAGMKGKKVVVAQYTPSHYFILWYLHKYNLKQSDVQMIWAPDAIAAKDTFINDKSIDVCITWSPFIYDITDTKKPTYVKGARLLASSQAQEPDSVYGLIADVYLARADLVKNHPEVIDAFVKAMVEGYALFNADKTKIAGMIAGFFGIKGGADEVMAMFNDVTIGGPKENKEFFDKQNSKSAYAILDLAIRLYKENGGNLAADFTIDPSLVILGDPMLKAAGK